MRSEAKQSKVKKNNTNKGEIVDNARAWCLALVRKMSLKAFLFRTVGPIENILHFTYIV